MTQVDAISAPVRRLRSAMFVDFDNVYLGLQRLDLAAAKSFAEDPGRWVATLTHGADSDGPFTRRFLVRKCYLNPAAFSRYRPNFTRAGFQVVDCPSLTQQGKSSADISLVLDAVDALGASTRFDEFVFLSADADFTPLITRCRAADRQVTVITPGPAAAAYRAVADHVMTADSFIELLAPVSETPRASRAASAHTGSIARRGTESDVAATAVRQLLDTTDKPVVLATAASAASRTDPELSGSAWDGAGSFTNWVQRTLPELVIHTRAPGYVWDPTRFTEADLPPREHRMSDFTGLQLQVESITEIPALETAEYRLLLEQLAFDLALSPFNRTDTSKRVRDECAKQGGPVGRAAINFVINGLLLAGTDLNGKPVADELAQVWTENVLGLCRGARMELSDDELGEVAEWVSGGLIGPTAVELDTKVR
ncbi:hypothetical protein J2Y46_000958 [Microbacterium sp. BE35]|uniref:NYN domain-containing protein n=1 Tax=Microbacterium sp. BE35 TaxID=2817773 RepID=UPI00285CBC06|nr:NYN domain-containing protein [Microbacterium sp. BE35]MDR7188142.1 hypothetical protein [Microbacterium sp. BE35]